ncbi:TetR/AcrR family transcriptional regulator [uncultured Marinobacter sp.]|uniref:TetR/AcrR family transcriptional regulator n=1 Tax=uncultured Marinobacter sp. TaxID=187379 RepID=UPI0030D7D094
MKVTRAEAEANRERVIETAGRLFREQGIDGIGLNDLMQAAGLTRGGFYRQFDSKLDLTVQAMNRAKDVNQTRWGKLRYLPPEQAREQLIRQYLSDYHVSNPGDGCVLAALGGDAVRQPPEVRRVYTENLLQLLDLIGEFSHGEAEGERSQQAMATLSLLVGALVLSRAVDDDSLSRELRESAINALLKPEAE